MSSIKERFKKFRYWQRHGDSYDKDNLAGHDCPCCGMHYEGNFCPVCGQRGGSKRVTWSSVRSNTLEVWGLGNRSMLYTLWQLLLRPGYLISDYINGKRQVSFPPFKMLIIVGLGMTIIDYFVDKYSPKTKEMVVSNDSLGFIDSLCRWGDDHYGLSILIFCSFFILPTWALFRQSPRNTCHTLPEGFFIQTFIAILIMIVATLGYLIDFWVLIPLLLYYFFSYKQLFGYSIWGTLWRFLLLIIGTFLSVSMMSYLVVDIASSKSWNNALTVKTVATVIIIFIIAIVIYVGFIIDNRRKKCKKRETTKQPEQLTVECKGENC